MTEQVNNESNAQSSTVANNFSQPVTQKTYTDEEVNRIAASKKQDGYQKGYDAAKAEYHQQSQQNFTPAQNNVAPVNPLPQSQPTLTVEQARAVAKEEVQNILQAQNSQLLINNFITKVNAGASKVENFNYQTVEKELNLPQNPAIWVTASEFENPAAILNELWKNPRLYADAKTLSDSPAMLRREMQKIAESLKQNEEAAKAPVAPAPLTRQKPSTLGVDSGKDKSEFTVSDWKQIFRK